MTCVSNKQTAHSRTAHPSGSSTWSVQPSLIDGEEHVRSKCGSEEKKVSCNHGQQWRLGERKTSRQNNLDGVNTHNYQPQLIAIIMTSLNLMRLLCVVEWNWRVCWFDEFVACDCLFDEFDESAGFDACAELDEFVKWFDECWDWWVWWLSADL